MQICCDGSFDASRGIIGAASLILDLDGNWLYDSCSYSGMFTGSEVAEHVALRCSLKAAHRLSSKLKLKIKFNMDSVNALGRYTSGDRELPDDIQYLEPLIELNKLEIFRLRAKGHETEFEWMDRRWNARANDQAREMKDQALRGVFRPLTRLEDDEEDHTITEAVNKASRLLRRRGAPSRSRVARQRARFRDLHGPSLFGRRKPFPSQDSPQPPGFSVCNCACATCKIHRCGFKSDHPLRFDHECYDCHHDLDCHAEDEA